MKKKKSLPDDNIPISYSLNSFSIRKFSLIEPGTDIIPSLNEENLKLGFSIEFAFNHEYQACRIDLKIGYNYSYENKSIMLLDMVLLSDFIIENIDEVIKSKQDVLLVPHQLLLTFTSLTYSTARGIIFTKTLGSYLNRFILPVIDPNVLLQNALKQNELHNIKIVES